MTLIKRLLGLFGHSKPSSEDDGPAHQFHVPDDFPFRLVTVPSAEAFETWKRLAEDPDTTPIIVGSDLDLQRAMESFDADLSVEDTLALAADLSHPQSLIERRDAVRKALAEQVKGTPDAHLLEGDRVPEPTDPELLGTWPSKAEPQNELYRLQDLQRGGRIRRAHIVVLPTADATEAPAWLRFGGWNDCPAPEYLVAALRDWRDRYGAVPVVISSDVMEVMVSRRPESREEALDLAIEQYRVCEDIVVQGTQTISALAATLAISDFWFFWWD